MDNVAKISQVSNSVKSIPTVVHMGVPVVTTEMLAGVYGTEVNNIQVNFSRNKDRFIEGKHFHKLTGSILKEFKNWLTQSKLVYKGASIISKHAKSLILWTERGAARHAKMLDTDQAWDVFEALEDFYFCKKEEAENKRKAQKTLPGKITAEQQEAIKQLVMTRGKALPKEKQAKAMITMWSSLKSHFGCTYKEIGSDKFTEALSLAARVPLEGEYIPAQESLPVPKMDINYPLTWYPDNFPYVDMCFYKQGQLRITRSMLAETRSPSREIFSKLKAGGYDVAAAEAEVDTLRHFVTELSWAIDSIGGFVQMRDRIDKTFTA